MHKKQLVDHMLVHCSLNVYECVCMQETPCLHVCWIAKQTVDTPVNIACCAFAHTSYVGGCVCVHARGQLALTVSRTSGQVQLSLCTWRGEAVTCLSLPLSLTDVCVFHMLYFKLLKTTECVVSVLHRMLSQTHQAASG